MRGLAIVEPPAAGRQAHGSPMVRQCRHSIQAHKFASGAPPAQGKRQGRFAGAASTLTLRRVLAKQL